MYIPDWDELLGAARAAPNLITEAKRVSPYHVLQYEGHHEWEQQGGRLVTLCPFHDDSSPSFAVYGENMDRCGCWSCGLNGDVLDLLSWIRPGWGLKEKIAYLDTLVDMGQTHPLPEITKPEPADMQGIYDDANEPWTVALYIEHREWPFNQQWLTEKWGVRGRYGEILVPHLDTEYKMIGLKHRDTETKLKSYTGSRFTELYGAWRDVGRSTVILTEGESDAWVASYYFPDYDVLGLPSGAAQRPFGVERFESRTVYLWFDGDDPGRQATERWRDALLSCGASVFVVPMADGCDVAGLPDPRLAFRDARPAARYSGPIAQSAGVYVRNGGRNPVQLTDWTFEPERVLRSDEGDAYEGRILPSGEHCVLTTPDLSSATRMVSWGSPRNGAWFGGTRDAQELLAYFHATTVGLPTGRLTRVVGLHEDTFVLPEATLGPQEFRYAPPQADIGLKDMLGDYKGKKPDGDFLDALRNLHTPAVMDPILAWFGLAPLRSMFREFPLLMVSGAAGTGKTTIVETLLRVLSPGIVTTNLTATTPYAIDSFVASTNGVPVWFDEYRPGGRKDTIERLNQILRDAYTRQPSYKGGTTGNLSELRSVVPAAPIIISGEDIFSETSHLERAIVVALPRRGREPDALRRVLGARGTSLWHPYVSWLLENLEHLDYVHDPTLHDNPRICTNLNRLTQGWGLLRAHLSDQYGFRLGEPTFASVTEVIDDATSTNPILDMLRWGYDVQQGNPFTALVWRDGDDLCVSLRNLLHEAGRNGTFALPGGAQAVRRYLADSFGASETRTTTPYGNIRFLRIPEGMNLVE